ncbi:FxLD family lanthipeptide [Actinoplanes sp. NBC_00393]|uniref:FxLD family lanthipeptide n=1 Tax=Actinoplanes sp. NBC_00393 TaxID=2975953 RepID=UPI002E210E83
MTIQLTDPPAPQPAPVAAEDFELDIEFVEAGDTVKHLIYATNDGCGSTCQSACTSCG